MPQPVVLTFMLVWFITASGFASAFAVCGLFPLAALPFIPGRSGHYDSSNSTIAATVSTASPSATSRSAADGADSTA